MFSYIAYGLGIQSSLPIPEFVEAAPEVITGSDVVIRIDQEGNLEDYRTETAIQQQWDLTLTLEESRFFVDGVGVFLIRQGKEIIIIPASESTEQVIRFYLVGTGMAILLYQRGLLVLHGSVVEIGQGASIFLGASGAGKSSTTVALHARGLRILADDAAAINLQTSPITVAAGFPQIKVSPEVARSLGYDFESFHLLHPYEQKRGYRLPQATITAPLPIHRIYVLAYGDQLTAEPLRPQEAVMELVRHSRPTTLHHCGGTSHFLQCVQLAKAFPVYRLERPHSLDLLPAFAQFIETHASSELSRAEEGEGVGGRAVLSTASASRSFLQ